MMSLAIVAGITALWVSEPYVTLILLTASALTASKYNGVMWGNDG